MTNLEIELPEGLKSQGVEKIAIQDKIILIEYKKQDYVFTLFKSDVTKTTRQIEEKMNLLLEPITTQGLIALISRGIWNGSQVNNPDTNNNIHHTVNPYVGIKNSFSQWQKGLGDRYEKLKKIIEDKMPELWESFEFELSITRILNIKDCSLPFAGVVLGSPSGHKTVGIELFRHQKNTRYTDNFTPKSFVSHNTTVPKSQLAEIDLLPKIKNKVLLVSEMSPVFSKRDEDLIELLGILTRVLDGHGYESDSGAHGHRGYSGEHMFVMIGAAVDIPRRVYKHLAALGAKLYFLRLKPNDKTEEQYLQSMKTDDFKQRVNEIRIVLVDYLDWFDSYPNATVENDLVKITWDADKDEVDASKYIIKLGILLAHLRGSVETWDVDDTAGLDYAYTMSTIERPDRAITQLRNLARGHALTKGRNYITIDDVPLLVDAVLSTASRERVEVFKLLIGKGGILGTSDVTEALTTSPKTAKRTMAEFVSLGIVDLLSTYERTIKLRDEFRWFIDNEEFKKLRPQFELFYGNEGKPGNKDNTGTDNDSDDDWKEP